MGFTRLQVRTVLRLAGMGLALVTVVLWLFGGPNLGWTKTSVPVEKFDEVSKISYKDWEKRFLPGVDFVAAGLAAGAVLFGASFLFHKKPAP